MAGGTRRSEEIHSSLERIPEMRYPSLSPTWKQVVQRMQLPGFGEIGHLVVRGGAPCLDPPPEPHRRGPLPEDEASRPEAALPDFVPKQKVVALVHLARRTGNCAFEVISVQEGLPISFDMKGPWSGTM